LRLKLICNPTAGRGRAHRRIGEVLAYLTSRGARVEMEESSSPEDLTRRAAESSRADYDRVIICGGDGSLNLAVREYDLGRIPMALLPFGSGDDFANVCGIPRSLRKACDVALEGQIREVDVALANGKRYMGVAGLGFDSEVNEYANQNGRYLSGSLVYLYAIFRVLPKFKPHRVRISTGNGTREEEIMFAAVGNSRQYGGGIRITPDARIDDHLLDVCIVHRTSIGQLLTTLPRAYNGSHVRKPFVETGRGLEFRFEADEPLKVFGDGEHLTQTPVQFGLAEKKLQVIVPRGSEW
jgi:diacylglycerol kinase (ATP)